MNDPELDQFVADVVRDTARRATAAEPDIAAVVALAHQLDPVAVPDRMAADVAQFAPVVALHEAHSARDSRDDPELDAFIGEVRAYVQHRAAIETAPEPATPPHRHRRATLFAVAAVLVAAVGLGWVLAPVFGNVDPTRIDARSDTVLTPDLRPDADDNAAIVRPPTPNRPPTAPQPPRPADVSEEDEVVILDEVEVDPPRPSRSVRRPARPLRERLAALEAEANQAWKEGRLDAAATAFHAIIALDKRGRWSENAFGELFTLQRQRGQVPVDLWSTYLERFPRGRFADDARAGLCSSKRGDARTQCWRAYLQAMPQGSFRARAHEELSGSDRR